MHRERQAILSLIALGKMTPREAERLLAVWNAGREEPWIIGVCAAACLTQFLPEPGRMTQLCLSMHHALAAITYWMGGML
jgi:hypothetical protein